MQDQGAPWSLCFGPMMVLQQRSALRSVPKLFSCPGATVWWKHWTSAFRGWRSCWEQDLNPNLLNQPRLSQL